MTTNSLKEEERKEKARIYQKHRRSFDNPTRDAMTRWNHSLAGKMARAKWAKEHPETRRKGTKTYETKVKRLHESIDSATNSRKEWTAEEELSLVNYLANGKTQPETAKLLGRSIRSIERKFQKLTNG